MARHELPTLVRHAKRQAAPRRLDPAQAPRQDRRCLGAAPQLSSVHDALRRGPVVQRAFGFEMESGTNRADVAGPQADVPQVAEIPPLAAPAMLEIVTGLETASNAAENLGESEIKAKIAVLRPLLEKLKKMAGSSAPPEQRRRGPPDGTT